MRLLYTLLLITALPFYMQAQKGAANSLSSQLKKVLAEASNGFKDLKGKQVKKEGAEVNQEGDVAYASTITLQGTTENRIMDFDAGGSYMAKLGEVSSTKEAEALVESWKKKLVAIVGSSYEITKDNQGSDEVVQNGYLLTSDKVSISIYYIKYKEEDAINAFILIMRL